MRFVVMLSKDLLQQEPCGINIRYCFSFEPLYVAFNLMKE